MLSRGGDGKPVSNLLAGKRHRKCFYKRGLLGRTLTPGLHLLLVQFPGNHSKEWMITICVRQDGSDCSGADHCPSPIGSLVADLNFLRKSALGRSRGKAEMVDCAKYPCSAPWDAEGSSTGLPCRIRR